MSLKERSRLYAWGIFRRVLERADATWSAAHLDARFGGFRDLVLKSQRETMIQERLATAFQTTDHRPTIAEAPVFVLSCGWRSGSTLVQRVMCTDPSVLLWGEPYASTNLIPDLSRTLARALAAEPDLHRKGVFVGDRGADALATLASSWIANFYPDLSDLTAGHAAMLTRMFGDSARRHGFARWGLKEVRFGREEIEYLRYIFPQGRFVLLVRHPVAAWASYRGKRFGVDSVSGRKILTPKSFGEHWGRLASSFVEYEGRDELVLLRYEDLSPASPLWKRVAEVTGLAIDPAAALEVQTGSTKTPVPDIESKLVLEGAGEAVRQLGYEPGAPA